jgi:hypothetical protein
MRGVPGVDAAARILRSPGEPAPASVPVGTTPRYACIAALDRLTLVKGKVEDTIPGTIPDAVSILRLDTDFYESTYHELVHLYPRLSRNGVLIVDDYDYWKGSRQATDQYFAENGVRMLLQRMDVGRIGVKTSDPPKTDFR